MDPFEYVASGVVPRELETAIAMGFAVDDLIDFSAASYGEKASATIQHHALRDDRDLHRLYVEFPIIATRDPSAAKPSSLQSASVP